MTTSALLADPAQETSPRAESCTRRIDDETCGGTRRRWQSTDGCGGPQQFTTCDKCGAMTG